MIESDAPTPVSKCFRDPNPHYRIAGRTIVGASILATKLMRAHGKTSICDKRVFRYLKYGVSGTELQKTGGI